jgi:carboxypeptidase Q
MKVGNSVSILLFFLFALSCTTSYGQNEDSVMIRKIFSYELLHGACYQNLSWLCTRIGPRLSGSPQAEEAVRWTKDLMNSYGFDTVYLQPVMVPHWVRGEKETAKIFASGKTMIPDILALGNSIGTGKKGIRGKVIEVKSFSMLDSIGEKSIKGKIVFFNQRMDPTLISTGQAYGDAGYQRFRGPAKAARLGAVGVVVRSLTTGIDDYPHTGSTTYEDSIPKIPAIAISTNDAEELSRLLKADPSLEFYFRTNCSMMDDIQSYNVIGEIRGTEFPAEIIDIGGHLDSWDPGQGAHDDGTGCMQAVEVLRILKNMNYHPNRTIRAVMFMNEENGLRGGKKYAEMAAEKKEKHLAAIESDSGGFSPRGFGLDADDAKTHKFMDWAILFEPYLCNVFRKGGGGADISPMSVNHVPMIGFIPDTHKYFNYHHTALDRIEAVDQRELELGAAAITSLVFLIDQHGL